MGHVGEELRLVAARDFELLALLLDLAEQPRVLDRQGRLGCEGLKQVDDLLGKVAYLLSPDRQSTHDPLLAEKRNRQNRSISEAGEKGPHGRGGRLMPLQEVQNLDWRPSGSRLPAGALTQTDRRCPQRLNHLVFHALAGSQMKLLFDFVVLVNNSTIGPRELDCVADDGAKDRLEVESGTNCLTNLPQRFQFPDRLRQLARARLALLEKAHVLNRDHSLVGEGFEKGNLLFRERVNLHAANHDRPDRDTLSQQRRRQCSAMSEAFLVSQTSGKIVFRDCRHIVNVDQIPVNDSPATDCPTIEGYPLIHTDYREWSA